MAEVNQQPLMDDLDKTGESFKNQLESDFKEINDQIKNKPEKINKIDEDVMKNLDTYLSINPKEVNQTLLNVMDALKDPNNKLWNRDEKSLNAIKELCEKYTTMEKAQTYQMNTEIFNDKFDSIN